MSSDTSTDKTVRREKLVMALGIAAIILFSANLMAMATRHFWPDFADWSPFSESDRAVVAQVNSELIWSEHPPIRLYMNAWQHNNTAHDFSLRFKALNRLDDFERELDRLERDIERESLQLQRDMHIQSASPEARTVEAELSAIEAELSAIEAERAARKAAGTDSSR